MSVKEGLLEHEHIALNTTIYYVTKQQIDNWKFSHKPTTIGLHKLSSKPWKRHSADRQWKIIDENINFCFGTPINRKITVCLLINLTRSPPQKRLGPSSPPPPFPLNFRCPPCVGAGGGRLRIFSGSPHCSGYHKNLIQQLVNIYFRLGGFQSPSLWIFVALRVLGRGGYGYFLELHIVPDITKTSSNNCLIFTSVSVDSSPRSYLSTSATVRIPVHTATKSDRNLSGMYWRIHFQDRCGTCSQRYRNRAEITVL